MSDVAPAGIMMMGVRDSRKKENTTEGTESTLYPQTTWATVQENSLRVVKALYEDLNVLKIERETFSVVPTLIDTAIQATFNKSLQRLHPFFSLTKKIKPTPQLLYL